MYHNKQHLLLLYFCASLFITMDAAVYTPPDNKAIQKKLLYLLLPTVELAYDQASNVTNNKEVLKNKLKHGNNKVTAAVVNKSYKWYNVIHLIAETGDIALWNLLSQHTLINCKQCNQKDGNGWAPIHYAAFYNHDNILKKLLEVPRININIATEKEQALALHLAAYRNAIGVLEVLKDHKKTKNGKHFAIHKKDRKRRTPEDIYLLYKVKGVKYEDIKKFLKGGVQTSPKSKTLTKKRKNRSRTFCMKVRIQKDVAKNPNSQPLTALQVLDELNNKCKLNNRKTSYGSITTTDRRKTYVSKNAANLLRILNDLFTVGVIGVVLYVVCKFVFLNIRHMLKQ